MATLWIHWANYKRSLKADNPFYNILRQMILCRLLPYRTVDDIYAHRVDYRRLSQMRIIHYIRILTFVRYSLIAIGGDGPFRILLLENFKEEPNQRQYFFTVNLILLCPSLMYYISFYMLTKPKRIFQGLFVMSYLCRNIRRIKTKQHTQFCMALNVMIRGNFVLVTSVTFLTTLIHSIDTYQTYANRQSVLIYFLMIFWNFELFLHIAFASTFAIFWFQFQVIVVWYLRANFILVGERLNTFKRLAKYLDQNSKDMTLHKLLGDLDVLINWSMSYTNQAQMFIGALYYVLLVALDGLILILIDPHTIGYIRMLSLVIFQYASCITVVLYLFYSTFNYRARLIGRNLEYFLFRPCGISSNLRMKICEIYAGLMADKVGVRCADVFVFNRLRFMQLTISFIVTFFLIFQLFQDYFTNSQTL